MSFLLAVVRLAIQITIFSVVFFIVGTRTYSSACSGSWTEAGGPPSRSPVM